MSKNVRVVIWRTRPCSPVRLMRRGAFARECLTNAVRRERGSRWMHRKAEEEVGAEPPADDDNAARRRLGHAQQGMICQTRPSVRKDAVTRLGCPWSVAVPRASPDR
ncbi:hypothetical protein GCM10023074_16830 [Microbispora amethystogenes]|uniref:Uncharacterized protein n=1 Tax=Microbispora amethystogenes TaxID=1427754 RepID=A0ABQ4F717_9ACTN|nr:hypothetical protein Mam01_07580 [Microbispora amethystogenes]